MELFTWGLLYAFFLRLALLKPKSQPNKCFSYYFQDQYSKQRRKSQSTLLDAEDELRVQETSAKVNLRKTFNGAKIIKAWDKIVMQCFLVLYLEIHASHS